MPLHLNLKKKWFDMIKSGSKKEEYREIKDYWARRLVYSVGEIEGAVFDEMVYDMRMPYRLHESLEELLLYFGVKFKQFKSIRFKNGYSKDAPFFDIEVKGITIKQGKKEWGAVPGKFYFVFSLGSITP